jgi:dienelactone hydrolase
MERKFLRLSVVGGALLAAALASPLVADTCTMHGELKTYFEENKTVTLGTDTSRCDLTPISNIIGPGGDGGPDHTGPGAGGGGLSSYSCHAELKGYLYKPASTSKTPDAGWPLIVYNHGSEELPGDMCELGSYFADLGYVVFVPHRRGHGKSTGQYLTDRCGTSSDPGQCNMDYLHLQVDDVSAALAYLKTLSVHKGVSTIQPIVPVSDINPFQLKKNAFPLVDTAKIGFIGHSFGGILSVFANEQDLGQKAVVDIAGCSQSWHNTSSRNAMVASIQTALRPTFLLEPMNDQSIEPTYKLAWYAAEQCRQFQATLYGAVDINDDGVIDDKDYAEDPDNTDDVSEGRNIAHGRFTTEKIKTWGPAADEFLQRYFKNPSLGFSHRCIGTSIQNDND